MNATTRKIADACTIDQFLAALSRGREIYALEAAEGGRFSLPVLHQRSNRQYHLVRVGRWDSEKHTLGDYRPIEPLKSVLFQPREYLGPMFEGSETPSLLERMKTEPTALAAGAESDANQSLGPEASACGSRMKAFSSAPPLPDRIVIGVKNCDLAGLRIQDHVFRGLPPGDPRYVEAREKTILVSCDCTDCLDVCFCPVVGVQPYAEKGYDINISPLSNQYLIDAGSERGEQLLETVSDYLADADNELLEDRDQRRAAMVQKLVDQAADSGLRPGMDLASAVRGAADSSMWEEFATDCVECGACNFVCCTCHCFQLADGTSDGVAARGKQWDGCLLMNFARVAGGANPRAGRAKRLRNRFQKKFDYFPEVLGCYACDGCGRCSEVCTGNIDIREVLKRAVDETESLHADRGND
jgi:sulfhydrogenase subunit beta (sulfur reductase)